MICLLDTHAFLWAVFDPQRLGHKAAEVAGDPGNRVWVSVVTLWEISLKHALGKLELENVLPEDFPDIAEKTGFDLLPLAPADAASFHRLPRLGHKDPFDRLLIWQAIRQKLHLVSGDAAFSAYRKHGLKVLW